MAFAIVQALRRSRFGDLDACRTQTVRASGKIVRLGRNSFVVDRRNPGMAEVAVSTDAIVMDAQEPTQAEIEAFRREQVLLDEADASDDRYPRMFNLSAGFLYRAIVRPDVPEPPEYVTLTMRHTERVEFEVAVARWNLLWEAAQFRRRFFDEDELPARMRRVADRGDLNVVFVPRTRTRYYEHAPLFHLLPRDTVRRFGLPLLRGGQWPPTSPRSFVDDYLPQDFELRLERAWAVTVWRHLMPASPVSAFSKDDPIRLLAHNLDFWLPPVSAVLQEILRDFPTANHGIEEAAAPLSGGGFLEGAVAANPRKGGDLWSGESEAADVVAWTVDQADADGRLRGILDAVRSHRVEDDFSDRWSYAREDFERKLYRKRSKVRVRFVELTDNIPVQGPETEVEGRLVFADFLALLDRRDRQIVVLLNSGTTKLTDIAEVLGYRNHSPISKRLKRIREQAARYFHQVQP